MNETTAFVERHPELYRITAPPKGAVRALAGFEPVDAVYLAWWPGEHDVLLRQVTSAVLRFGKATPIVLHHGAQEAKAIRRLLDGVPEAQLAQLLNALATPPGRDGCGWAS